MLWAYLHRHWICKQLVLFNFIQLFCLSSFLCSWSLKFLICNWHLPALQQSTVASRYLATKCRTMNDDCTRAGSKVFLCFKGFLLQFGNVTINYFKVSNLKYKSLNQQDQTVPAQIFVHFFIFFFSDPTSVRKFASRSTASRKTSQLTLFFNYLQAEPIKKQLTAAKYLS